MGRSNREEPLNGAGENPYSLEFDLPDPAALDRNWNYTDHSDRLYRTAHGILARGFFAEAENQFSRALHYDRSHYLAYVGRAEALVLMGQSNMASMVLRAASERYGRNCAIGAALGHAYLHLGHFDEAAECADIATANDPESAYPWLIAGEVRLSIKHGERYAMTSFEKAQGAREPWPYLKLRIGLAYLEWGPREQALAIFEKFTSRHADVPLGWIFLGDTHRVLGRARAARICYKKALELSPGLDSVRRAISWSAELHNVWRGIGRRVRRALSS